MAAVVKHCWYSCAKKKKLQRMINKYYWLCAEEILTCSVVREIIRIALFICLRFKDELGLCSINCHIHGMTGNCSASL